MAIDLNTLLLSLISLTIFLYLARILIRFLRTVWLEPKRIARLMAAQGIRGPPYQLIHGSTKQASKMLADSMTHPMEELSHRVFPKVQPHLHAWATTYGRNNLIWHGPTPVLMVGEPELIKEVLADRDGSFPKGKADGYVKKLMGEGLATSEGKKWVKHRKIANHAFHGENLKGMIPAMVMSMQDMLNKWKEYEGKEIELSEEFNIVTSEVISRTAFGSSYMQGKNIFTKIEELGVYVVRNAQKVQLPFFSKFLRDSDAVASDRVVDQIRDAIGELIKIREEMNKMGDPDGYGNDFLGLLVKAKHEVGTEVEVTFQDIIDECKTFYFAGHETTANLLCWTCLLLASNTEWQDRARKEVMMIFGDRNPTSDDAGIGRLKTMTMILNESARLYPPLAFISRKVEKGTRLGKLIIPENMDVGITPVAVHHDTIIWGENAHLFRPERFSEGVAAVTNSSMAFLPFGGGPRYCVGQHFAMTQAKVALTMILRKYAFTVSPTYVHSPIHHITIRPQHGLQLVLHKV